MSDNRLIMGTKMTDPSDLDILFKFDPYTQPFSQCFYVFHVEYANVDQRWNAPGVFPKWNLFVTRDMFPMVNAWWQVGVGPLLARSSTERVFISMVKGDPQKGSLTRLGLIRVSTLSVPQAYEGEELNEPLLGEMKAGDMSHWRKYHPPIETKVRMVFPKEYAFPPAMMYDFKVLRPIACIPHLIADLTDSTRPVPTIIDSHYPSRSTGGPSDNNATGGVNHVVPISSYVENPLMRSLAAAYAAASSTTQSTLSASSTTQSTPSASARCLPSPTNLHLPLAPVPRRKAESTSLSSDVRPVRPLARMRDTSYASIESVLSKRPAIHQEK